MTSYEKRILTKNAFTTVKTYFCQPYTFLILVLSKWNDKGSLFNVAFCIKLYWKPAHVTFEQVNTGRVRLLQSDMLWRIPMFKALTLYINIKYFRLYSLKTHCLMIKWSPRVGLYRYLIKRLWIWSILCCISYKSYRTYKNYEYVSIN